MTKGEGNLILAEIEKEREKGEVAAYRDRTTDARMHYHRLKGMWAICERLGFQDGCNACDEAVRIISIKAGWVNPHE